MTRTLKTIAVVIATAALMAVGYWWFVRGDQSGTADENNVAKVDQSAGPIASVKVAAAKKETISEDITVYGTVVPATGAVQTISVPYESRIRRISVTEGQRIAPGEPLLEIEPSPDTSLLAQQARNDYQSAKTALEYMQQRFDLKLATNDQLLQARQALDQAQAKSESMRRRGSESSRAIRAEVSGLISKISVQEGAIVAAGSSLVEVVAQNRLAVRLGVEPDNIDKVKPEQKVSLQRVNVPESGAIIGRIQKISRAADPATRLVQVFADLPPSSQFLLGEYVLGKIAIASAQGLIVPRSAVLPMDDHYILFTVENGRAKEHTVRLGLQNKTEVQIIAATEFPSDAPVVILGNTQLKDDMSVKVDPAR